jgi:hypothetical protein
MSKENVKSEAENGGKPKEATKVKPEIRSFFFPDLGRTIQATSIEEATEIVEKEKAEALK